MSQKSIATTRALLALCAFSGAALLFVVQPMLAKWLLPGFGGSPSTWAACMVFFQGMLLAGYAYAHGLMHVGPRVALAIHGLLLAIAASFAAYACTLPAPEPSLNAPALQVAKLLGAQVGVSYFALSSTAPLVQRWAAHLFGNSPYKLYAFSNAGSLLGLLAYPFAIEPVLDVHAQFSRWTLAFGAYVLLMLALLAVVWRNRAAEPSEAERVRVSVAPPLTHGLRARWLSLSLLPSALLLAVTQHVTIDIAATPLLWVAPLAIYLLTFIAAFARPIVRAPLLVTWIAAVIAIGGASFAQGSASLSTQLVPAYVALLAAGLLCHGELARLQPAAQRLTEYYLWIACGGVLGSIAVAWLAPALLQDDYDLELCLLAIFALWIVLAPAWSQGQRRILYLGLGVCAPLLLSNLALRMQDVSAGGTVIERRRSFLGPLRVVDTNEGRVLTHGRIRHGMQLREPAQRRIPTMYFGEGTALARVMEHHAVDRPRTIGVVGLGVGTIAAYARAGDRVRFYELDPYVAQLARERFTFLSDSPGKIEVVLGDGRLALASEPPQRFDVLVIDAFSSDSVPVHLLTREAFAIYARQLAPDGVLLANVSNRHLAVERAVLASAHANQLATRIVQTDASAHQHVERVRWAVMTRRDRELASLLGLLPIFVAQDEVLFTDAHASLLSIVR